MTKHVMIDLETWDNVRTAQLRSIGAVLFDPHGAQLFDELVEPGDHLFYRNIAGYAAEDAFSKSESTVKWWSEQGKAAQEAFKGGQIDGARKGVEDLCRWILRCKPKAVWANSPTFDLEILRYHLNQFGWRCPWKFWQELDYRTVRWLLLKGKEASPEGFIKHRADHDAVLQAVGVQVAVGRYDLRIR